MVAFLSCVGYLIGSSAWAQAGSAPVGSFRGTPMCGTVSARGLVDYDAAKRTYTISGSGENMWFTADAFQFVWKKFPRLTHRTFLF